MNVKKYLMNIKKIMELYIKKYRICNFRKTNKNYKYIVEECYTIKTVM